MTEDFDETTYHRIHTPTLVPKSTANMAAQVVTRDRKGRVTSTSEIAIPAGITHAEAVAFVRRFTTHEIAQFVTYSDA